MIQKDRNTNNDVDNFILACSTGNMSGVKSFHMKYGKDIVNFGQHINSGEYRSGFFYAVKHGNMDIARYLKDIDRSNKNTDLSRVDVYNLFSKYLSDKNRSGRKNREAFHKKCVDILIDGLDLFDQETVVLAAIDAAIEKTSMSLYSILVDEFRINPSLFTIRMGLVGDKQKIESNPRLVKFFREIKLRYLLNE